MLFAIRQDPPARWRPLFAVVAFALPLSVWALVSYVPWLWHPFIEVTEPGGVTWLQPGMRLERAAFAMERERAQASGLAAPEGMPVNPIYLPAPHAVGRALFTAFTTPPKLKGDTWLHESLWVSIQTIGWGFLLSSMIALPLGVGCGSYPVLARMTEPFVDFIRYMPAPVFGALAVAVWGIYQGPKVAIIFIGTFFQQVLVVANTVRRVDPALIQAAQTLGARDRHLLLRVIAPACLVDLYQDTRVLLGWAWTYLVVAEVVGISSGITFFINQQAKYRNFENVYAAILIIGVIGLGTDLLLAWLGRRLFPWANTRPSRLRTLLGRAFAGRTVLIFDNPFYARTS